MRTTMRERIVPVLFAVGFFMLFGEEISWGQRLLGFETPEAFKEINVQDEFNLHNLAGYAADHIFIASVFLIFWETKTVGRKK